MSELKKNVLFLGTRGMLYIPLVQAIAGTAALGSALTKPLGYEFNKDAAYLASGAGCALVLAAMMTLIVIMYYRNRQQIPEQTQQHYQKAPFPAEFKDSQQEVRWLKNTPRQTLEEYYKYSAFPAEGNKKEMALSLMLLSIVSPIIGGAITN